MSLLDYYTDYTGLDCHVHSAFSPDARGAGAEGPQQIADAVRRTGLKGFIVTDHVDIGHWTKFDPINFDEYFTAWQNVKRDNPDLTIYIGLEVGFEDHTAEQTARLIKDLPLDYVINSVHYWRGPIEGKDHYEGGRIEAYTAYLNAVLASLDAPYDFNTVGHLGFAERYAPYPDNAKAIEYSEFKPLLDKIIDKALRRKVRFELNTNSGGIIKQPRPDFLKAYQAKGGIKPMLGSDAHTSPAIAQHFAVAIAALSDIFD